MQINLNLWTKNPSFECDGNRECVEGIRPALILLNAQEIEPGGSMARLPNGVVIRQFVIDLKNNSPLAVSIRKVLDITSTTLTFAIDKGAQGEITVAKLVGSQINPQNIARMIQAVQKLQYQPDGGALFNPDWGLITIGRTTDAPGGSLIGLNIFGNETNLDFDRKDWSRIFSGLALVGIMYAAHKYEQYAKTTRR